MDQSRGRAPLELGGGGSTREVYAWWSLYVIGLKLISAWTAAVIVAFPFLILKEVVERMKRGEFK